MQVNSAEPSTSSDGPSVRIPVDVRRFPWIRRLAADYAYDFRSVASFFSGDPADRAAWADAIARTQAHDRRRAEIAAVIAGQQERRQAPARAREAGRLLADRRTVSIVTGQQAGLFGGPLFTLLKALTALKLAEQVTRDHNVPAVAVFWIDAEDHDWEEVRSCTVFDDQLTARTVSLPARPGAEPAPVATVRLDHTIADTLSELERVLPDTEFRESLLARLRRSYAAGTGMADAFGRWLEEMLGDRGLVVYDSSDPASKPLVGEVFARELSMPGQTVKLAALAGSDLTARGYHAQVHAHDDGLALFHLGKDDGARRAIRQQELRGVYEHFGVPMPLFYPRASATILDSAALRFLTKYKLPLEALQAQDEAALNELLKTQIPQVVEDAFTGAAQAMEAQMTGLIQTIPALDPTLEGAARSTLERMQRDLQTLHGKMIQAAKRRDETLRRQFIHARALAFPGGHAQERTIGFVSFLNQYGPALVDRLDEELPLDLGHHWIVTI